MRVWLLHIGEDLPVDNAARTFRYGYLAKALADRGHRVLRWAPTFRHFGKTHRFQRDCRVTINENYAIQFVHSPGYRRNIGIARLQTYRILGRRFQELALRETCPDVIVAAIPSLEWADAAVEYARSHGVPVVVDVRDLWPDVFVNAVPASVHSLARLFLTPYRRLARRICRRATALTAVSQTYLNWALDLAGRDSGPHDHVVPLGFEPDTVPDTILQTSVARLMKRGVDTEIPTCLFAGSFERSHDLETVIDAASKVQRNRHTNIQLLLCGNGSTIDRVQRRAEGLRHVHFLGWADPATLQAATSMAQIGLCPYATDALQSLPNKPFEYMAGRLAILSSLSGELEELITRHNCGLTYTAGNSIALVDRISQLILDRSKLELMRSNARTAWSQHYRSSVIYARFVDHLCAIMDSNKTTGKGDRHNLLRRLRTTIATMVPGQSPSRAA
jgi:glycosyltransferase involved in cell wall biosynthesis